MLFGPVDPVISFMKYACEPHGVTTLRDLATMKAEGLV